MKKGFNSLIRFTGVSLLMFFLGKALHAQTPVANPDIVDPISTSVNNVSIDPLLNDDLAGLDVLDLEITIIAGPSNGTADTSFNASSNSFSITYSPNLSPQFEGVDTLTYELCDTSGGQVGNCTTAEVQFRRGVYPDFPVAVADTFYVGQNLDGSSVVKDFNVIANDTLTLFGEMFVTIVNSPSKGTATVDPITQTIDYIPNLNEFGFDSVSYAYCDTFSYQQKSTNNIEGYYCDTVKSYIYVNQMHSGENETGDTVKMEIATLPYETQNYLSNNEDDDNDSLKVRGFNSSASGIVTVLDSTFLYTPDATLSSSGMPTYIDTLVYNVCDSLVNPNLFTAQNLEQCVSDTMFIVVVPAPFDSLPVVTTTFISDTVLFGETGTITIDAIDPEGGDIVVTQANGNETVNLNISGVANELSFTFDPVPGLNRSVLDTFIVRVCEDEIDPQDEVRCTDVEIAVLVKDTAFAPVAVNDSVSVIEEGEVTIELFINDTLNGSEFVSLDEPQFGSLEIDAANGVVTYTSFKDEPGTELLEYIICRDSCDTAYVVIEVTPVYEAMVIEGVSPNGDGINDQFSIQDINYDEQEVSVKIFNRWGNVIFEEDNYDENDPERSWRGQSNQGGTVTDGTYFYIVEIPDLDFTKSGDLLFISNK